MAGSVLYDLGEYPMLLERGDLPVKGMVVQIEPEQYQRILAVLDELEGTDPQRPEASIYTRERRQAVLQNGEAIPVWVYVGKGRYVSDAEPIGDGDWVRHAAAKQGGGPAWWDGISSVRGLHN